MYNILVKSHILNNQMSFTGVLTSVIDFRIYVMSPHSDDTVSSGSEVRNSLMLSWTKASSCSEFLEKTMVNWLSSNNNIPRLNS